MTEGYKTERNEMKLDRLIKRGQNAEPYSSFSMQLLSCENLTRIIWTRIKLSNIEEESWIGRE